ncbi:MAG: HEAT repeat domain-containing protein [Verrucomicrobiota bacterium]|nr:HEAT repeat domain-containing protein [Verrucomicrobiota bacterium]
MKKLRAGIVTGVIAILVLLGSFMYQHVHKRITQRQIGLKCLRDDDHLLLGLATLTDCGKQEDIPMIIPLLDDGNPHVRFTAAQTLEALSGHHIPIPSGLSGDWMFSNSRMKDHVFNLSNEAS